MLNEFIKTLEDVANNPVLPVLKGKFVKWDEISNPHRQLVAACPLTQVALKAGIDVPHLQGDYYPADYVCAFLEDHFHLEHDCIVYVWTEYDNGTPLLEIVAALELRPENAE